MNPSSPMLALAPGTTTVPGPGATTGPRTHRRRHDYRPDCTCPPCVSRTQFTSERAFAGLHHAGYGPWLDHVWTAAACTRPVRLSGDIRHIDSATGEVLRTIPTIGMPDGVIYKPCGNRRATVCPGCAETYRRDAYQLLRAGLAGGKGIPAEVATHPAIFATFTAPSFGPVHSRPINRHTCEDRSRCRCRPQPCHARRDAITCCHGRPAACFKRHAREDPILGQPLCRDCYDYPAHVVWNNQAGELWRRTKQAMDRYLTRLARRRGVPFHRIPCGDGTYRWVSPYRLAHGKAAEYQARGAVHFHALLRLDGYNPDHPDQLLSPPPGLTAADLQDAAHWAAETIRYRTAQHPDKPDKWLIEWGTQTDVRVITTTGRLTDLAVASYLAKYATKGTETTGHASARITAATLGLYANAAGSHPERLIHACWELGREPAWWKLRRWAHMLGFGGQFLTKARRYSITFTSLRNARITYRRHQDIGPDHGPIHATKDADEETVLAIGTLTYTATGWKTTGDALLANTAANQARKRRQAGHDQLSDSFKFTTSGHKAA